MRAARSRRDRLAGVGEDRSKSARYSARELVGLPRVLARSGNGVSAPGSADVGAAALHEVLREALGGRGGCSSPDRSSGRSREARVEEARAASGRRPRCRECGVAVTRSRWRSGRRRALRRAGERWCGRRGRRSPSAQVWASSTITSSGQARRKSSRRRSALMKSVETITIG